MMILYVVEQLLPVIVAVVLANLVLTLEVAVTQLAQAILVELRIMEALINVIQLGNVLPEQEIIIMELPEITNVKAIAMAPGIVIMQGIVMIAEIMMLPHLIVMVMILL